MCNCQNCKTEGYFEHVNGYVPADCIHNVPRPSADEEVHVFLTDEPDHLED